MLAEAGFCRVSADTLARLNERVGKSPPDGSHAVYLTSKVKDVERHNARKFQELKDNTHGERNAALDLKLGVLG